MSQRADSKYLKSLKAGSTVVVHANPNPFFFVMHVCPVKKIENGVIYVEYGSGWHPFCQETGYGFNINKKIDKRMFLQEATKERVKYVNSMKEKRALLQRIHRLTVATSRYRDETESPLYIPKKIQKELHDKLNTYAINSLVERSLKAEANTSVRGKRTLTLEEIRWIWDKIKEVEYNYLENENFNYKDHGDDFNY